MIHKVHEKAAAWAAVSGFRHGAWAACFHVLLPDKGIGGSCAVAKQG
jgi:hypothetical protein